MEDHWLQSQEQTMEARLQITLSKSLTMVESAQQTVMFRLQMQHLLHVYWITQSTIQMDKMPRW